MAPSPGESSVIGVDDLMALETNVLKTLCLTINTAGSELKYKILDSLSDDDFFFPITRAVYQTLAEMHRKGDYVISANIEEELDRAQIPVPIEFPLEQLFRGDLPALSELSKWVLRIRERSRSGLEPSVGAAERDRMAVPTPSPAAPPRAASPPPPPPPPRKETPHFYQRSRPEAQTIVSPVSEVKKRMATLKPADAGKSAGAAKAPPRPAASPPSASTAGGSLPSNDKSQLGMSIIRKAPVWEVDFEKPREKSSPSVKKPESKPASQPKAQPPSSPGPKPRGLPESLLKSSPSVPLPQGPKRIPKELSRSTGNALSTTARRRIAQDLEKTPEPPKRAAKTVLSSEGDDWASYMEDVASKQGKNIDTGFARLDEALGGIGTGLMVIVDELPDRSYSFLKQLTDQVASKSSLRCLYVASGLPKASLRLRTLSRLAQVPLKSIEKGRVKKDSPEWDRLDQHGRKAGHWLKRVFVHEIDNGIDLPLFRELIRKLLDTGTESTCLVVIDAVDKLGPGASQVVLSKLAALAASLEVLIIAATTDTSLLSSKETDYAAVFRETKNSMVELEVLQSEEESSVIVRFEYQEETCRFIEAER